MRAEDRMLEAMMSENPSGRFNSCPSCSWVDSTAASTPDCNSGNDSSSLSPPIDDIYAEFTSLLFTFVQKQCIIQL